MKRLLLILLLCAQPLAAQTPTPAAGARDQRTAWVSVGLSYMSLPYGLGANAGLSTRKGNRSFRLGLNAATDIKSSVSSNAVSISVGAHRKVGALHLELFAGPALVWGDDSNDDGITRASEPYQTVGLITDASALFGLGSRVRLGVGTWANINSQRSTVGAGPRLQISLR